MNQPTTHDAIDALRTRPRMFLRTDSVHDLNTFLTGYRFGLDVASPREFPHGSELVSFRQWLAKRLGRAEQESLDTLLLDETGNDEARAFRLFFERWDEFRASETES